MEACPGGGSRFGALSIVLGDMGFFWQMYTPPYIILLIRTFLTLEGIAGQVAAVTRHVTVAWQGATGTGL